MQDNPIDISSLLDGDTTTNNDLNVWKAFLITAPFFFSHYLFPFLFALLVIPSLVYIALKTNLNTTNNLQQMVAIQASSLGALFGDIIAALFTIFLSKKLIKDGLTNGGKCGAAWNVSNVSAIIHSIIFGIITYFGLSLFVSLFNDMPVQSSYTKSQTQIIMAWGIWPAIFLNIFRFLVSAPIEELLFRGVLFGTFTKKFGVFTSAFSTTILFIMLHLPLSNLTEVFTYSTFSFVAIWLRIRSQSVAPPITFHLSYNLCILFSTFVIKI